MTIRLLPESTINRIAAGEVIERPASVVKELVENAIDAGARTIEVTLEESGGRLIRVADDGRGMARDELPLALARHATSKLAEDGDLWSIRTLGFRGEALPSIAAVSRLTLTSRAAGAETAWSIEAAGGTVGACTPAARPPGTTVSVADLFYATPARLKFLKAPRTESGHAADTVNRLAMCHPAIGFTLTSDGRAALRDAPHEDAPEGLLARLALVMGRDFAENALPIDAERDGVRLSGYAALPTLNRASAQHQYLFVNGRPVRDRLLMGAVRAAYADHLHRGRHPMAALFVDLAPELVDVNVHPTKAEVRFRDGATVRGLIVGALKRALAAAGHHAATTVADEALAALRPHAGANAPGAAAERGYDIAPPQRAPLLAEAHAHYHAPLDTPSARVDTLPPAAREATAAEAVEHPAPSYPLGVARGQVHGTYVVAQTEDGIVIVDQHAAHERIVYERMKAALAEAGIQRQILLIPEVIELDEAAVGEAGGTGRRARRSRPGAGALRAGRGGRARGAGAHRRRRHRRPGARSRRRAGGLGRRDDARPAPRRRVQHARLPRQRPRRPQAQRRRDERTAAPDGIDPPRRPVQPRPPHLRRAEARRHRAPVRAALTEHRAIQHEREEGSTRWNERRAIRITSASRM